MKILIEMLAMDIHNGLISNTGSEGRWAQSWARLLAERGHDVTCVCTGNFGWGSMKPVPNIELRADIPPDHFDLALCPGEESQRKKTANLYIYMFFSPCFILENPWMYANDNQVIVCPFSQYLHLFDKESGNPYYNKTYLLPTPTAQQMHPPHFESNVITWSVRWGPQSCADPYIHAMIYIANKHNLHTKIFMKDNFFWHLWENEGNEGVAQLEHSLQYLPSVEWLPSLTIDQVYDVLKTTKVCVPYQPGGSSLPEQIVCGALPLPLHGTRYIVPHVDKKLYTDPYPTSIDELISLWEKPLTDRNFYEEAVKLYQEEMKHTLHDNCIQYLKDILAKYGHDTDI